MAVQVNHDKATKQVTVTLTFEAEPQVEKPTLEQPVIDNHLLGQAFKLCREEWQKTKNEQSRIQAEADAAGHRADLLDKAANLCQQAAEHCLRPVSDDDLEAEAAAAKAKIEADLAAKRAARVQR